MRLVESCQNFQSLFPFLAPSVPKFQESDNSLLLLPQMTTSNAKLHYQTNCQTRDNHRQVSVNTGHVRREEEPEKASNIMPQKAPCFSPLQINSLLLLTLVIAPPIVTTTAGATATAGLFQLVKRTTINHRSCLLPWSHACNRVVV